MRKKRESGKDLTMSSTPARFLSAGAEKRPLKRDRPAKERSLTEPFDLISEGYRCLSATYQQEAWRVQRTHPRW